MLNVLWTSNVLFPEAKNLISGTHDKIRSSGGWLLGMAGELSRYADVHIYVVCVSRLVTDLRKLEGEKLTYYVFPGGNSYGPDTVDTGEYDKYFVSIKEDINPDIVDIHGTEYVLCSSCLRVFGVKKTVVTIQGLLSECGRNYYRGLGLKEILLNSRFYEHNVIYEAKDFLRRAEYERYVLRNAKRFIGRTLWDKAHVFYENKDALYYHCDEVLRDEFYNGYWEYEKCTPHRIFLSNGSYPIKGLHELFEALPSVCMKYPDVKVFVAGGIITRGRMADIGNYARILRKRIDAKGLVNHIVFTGPLSAEQMKEQYLLANVFVSTSTVENGSNSLGEAQILGVPCVASCVGGIRDTIPDDSCGTLYPFGDNIMLAQAICDAFENKSFDNSHMRQVAHKRHSREENAKCLYEIYKSICRENT